MFRALKKKPNNKKKKPNNLFHDSKEGLILSFCCIHYPLSLSEIESSEINFLLLSKCSHNLRILNNKNELNTNIYKKLHFIT